MSLELIPCLLPLVLSQRGRGVAEAGEQVARGRLACRRACERAAPAALGAPRLAGSWRRRGGRRASGECQAAGSLDAAARRGPRSIMARS